ncbi:hypothetical protein JSX79_17195, partial [Curtobacterium sp. GD1]|nr:hypothetical protein [Curtobacterium sp. GD1]
MANIVTQIAEKVRPVGVSTNYGEPVEVGDQTLIPVSAGLALMHNARRRTKSVAIVPVVPCSS